MLLAIPGAALDRPTDDASVRELLIATKSNFAIIGPRVVMYLNKQAASTRKLHQTPICHLSLRTSMCAASTFARRLDKCAALIAFFRIDVGK